LIVKISHFGRGKSEKYMKDLSGWHAASKYLGKNLKKEIPAKKEGQSQKKKVVNSGRGLQAPPIR
jgi:hypothetical protein